MCQTAKVLWHIRERKCYADIISITQTIWLAFLFFVKVYDAVRERHELEL